MARVKKTAAEKWADKRMEILEEEKKSNQIKSKIEYLNLELEELEGVLFKDFDKELHSYLLDKGLVSNYQLNDVIDVLKKAIDEVQA